MLLTWKETLLASTSRKSTKLLHTVSFISISSCTITPHARVIFDRQHSTADRWRLAPHVAYLLTANHCYYRNHITCTSQAHLPSGLVQDCSSNFRKTGDSTGYRISRGHSKSKHEATCNAFALSACASKTHKAHLCIQLAILEVEDEAHIVIRHSPLGSDATSIL